MVDGPFPQVWAVDFEFTANKGERTVPFCVVAHELVGGARVRRWLPDAAGPLVIPDDAVMIAYMASAEISCFLELGWKVPRNVIDLSAEFRLLANGLLHPGQRSLLDALRAWKLPHRTDEVTKDRMRQRSIEGAPFSVVEMIGLLDYCESDVDALSALWPTMLPQIDVPRALLRGRYMVAVSWMERVGVPIDLLRLGELRRNWRSVESQLALLANGRYRDGALHRSKGVFERTRVLEEGDDGRERVRSVWSFRSDRFEGYLARRGIGWPRRQDGNLRLDDETWKQMVRFHPQLRLLYETRRTLLRLKLNKLAVGPSGRNRTLTGAFGARTGRNQPSNSKFVFGLPSWMRSLVRPNPGKAIAYVDWEQQEFGIAAALSRDSAMLAAYVSGDCYWDFAVKVGAIPEDGDRQEWAHIREVYKTVVLATQYLMSARTLAGALGIPRWRAQQYLDQHHGLFKTYWRWSDGVLTTAQFRKKVTTTLGWACHTGAYFRRERSIRNWPIQATGAEMMRLACILATEGGIDVCCPVHDALLIEAPEHEIDEAVAKTRDAMERASGALLGGFRLRTEAQVLCHGARFRTKKGAGTWDLVHSMLGITP